MAVLSALAPHSHALTVELSACFVESEDLQNVSSLLCKMSMLLI